MRIEVAEGKALHVGEEAVAQAAHGPLPYIDHEQIMQITADYADKQDGSEFDQGERQCRICGVQIRSGSEHGRDMVVYQCAGEQRRRQRNDG